MKDKFALEIETQFIIVTADTLYSDTILCKVHCLNAKFSSLPEKV